VAFGDIFNAADLDDELPLSARMIAQFVYGSQMGWFSLGGVTSGPNVDTGWVHSGCRPLVAPIFTRIGLQVRENGRV
jgi:hypothetical protein